MTVTKYIWDELSDNVRMEVDDTGAVTAEYMNEPGQFGQLISQRRNSTNSFYHFDAQGSTRQLTNDAQTVTDAYMYSAFGEPVSSTGSTTNPFRYNGAVGYYTDAETDEIYVRRRNYHSSLGRWLSKDPVLIAAEYQYDQNQPVSTIVPFGEWGGNEKTQNAICRVSIRCFPITRVIPIPTPTFVGPPVLIFSEVTLGWHCGLTIIDHDGTVELDGMSENYPVLSGDLIIRTPRDDWQDEVRDTTEVISDATYDPSICQCLRTYPQLFNRLHNEGYDAIWCNSNWALKCMLEECRLNINWTTKPFGYDSCTRATGGCARCPN